MKFKKLLLIAGLTAILTGCSELETATQDFMEGKSVNEVTNPYSIIEEKDPTLVESPTSATITPDSEVKVETKENVVRNSSKVDNSKANKPSYFLNKPEGEVFDATVVKVTDGDTLKVKYNGKEESVRLLLIDTPETVKAGTAVQLYGPEASAYAKKFFPVGSTVQIDIDKSERDKYGRLLAYVWKDGVMYQDAVLNEGLAIVTYIYKPNVSYVDHLRNVEAKAKAANKGVWSVKGYVVNGKYIETPADSKVTTNTYKEETKNVEQSKEVEDKIQSTELPVEETTLTKVESSIPDANGDGICNDVKGNQGSSGWIYHVPNGASYDKTNPEEVFCTTQEAESAGYRASAR